MLRKNGFILLLLVGFSAGAVAAPAKYQQACFACHSSGVAGAPKVGDKDAWAPLKAKGIEALLSSVKNGKGIMPAGGACADCTDEEYKAIIEWMTQ